MTKEIEEQLAERVLGRIQDQDITPKSRWHFLLREWVVWGMIVAALVLGSVASTLSFYISDASRFMLHQIEVSDLNTLFSIVPFLWLILLGVGIFYTVHAAQSTRGGYKWHPAWLVGVALCISLMFGWYAHAAGVGASIDRYLLEEMPLYKPLTGFEPTHFMNQQQGVVAGVVEEVHDEGFVVRKIDGEVLDITTTAATVMHVPEQLHEGAPVRVIGTTTEEQEFTAERVGSFHGRGGPTKEKVRQAKAMKKAGKGREELLQE